MQYTGFWFVQAYLVPRSVSGFKNYSDDVTRYVVEPDGRLSLMLTYRTHRCVTIVNDYIPLKKPGMFVLKDGFGKDYKLQVVDGREKYRIYSLNKSVGDSLSGISIIVVTDYHAFAIKWGCAGPLVKRICRDLYIIVKTRKRKPCKTTMRIIERVLDRLFRLRMRGMTKYTHNNPCPDNSRNSCSAFQKQQSTRVNEF